MLRKLKLKSIVIMNFWKMSEFQKFNDSFLTSENAIFIDNIYNQWLEDRFSVHSSWDAYFHNDANNLTSIESFSFPD
jgi:2-oxoglutarate dehydrogenase complex dehydrogenase (E1) component-like enzyme